MTKTIAITAIVLVAVVMGMSAIVPMIQYAEARHGGPDFPEEACNSLVVIAKTSPQLKQILEDHCTVIPPDPN